jgi:hypothetical protein
MIVSYGLTMREAQEYPLKIKQKYSNSRERNKKP